MFHFIDGRTLPPSLPPFLSLSLSLFIYIYFSHYFDQLLQLISGILFYYDLSFSFFGMKHSSTEGDNIVEFYYDLTAAVNVSYSLMVTEHNSRTIPNQNENASLANVPKTFFGNEMFEGKMVVFCLTT